MTGPNGTTRGAPASAHSSSNRCFWTEFQPGPPNSFGQPWPSQPFLPRILAQRCMSSRVRCKALCTLCEMSAGRFCRDPGADVFAELLFFGGEGQIHEVSPNRQAPVLARSCTFFCPNRDKPDRTRAGSDNFRPMKNIVILISGGGSNMASIVRAAQRESWETRLQARVAAVISNRPDAGGLAIARDRVSPPRFWTIVRLPIAAPSTRRWPNGSTATIRRASRRWWCWPASCGC